MRLMRRTGNLRQAKKKADFAISQITLSLIRPIKHRLSFNSC